MPIFFIILIKKNHGSRINCFFVAITKTLIPALASCAANAGGRAATARAASTTASCRRILTGKDRIRTISAIFAGRRITAFRDDPATARNDQGRVGRHLDAGPRALNLVRAAAVHGERRAGDHIDDGSASCVNAEATEGRVFRPGVVIGHHVHHAIPKRTAVVPDLSTRGKAGQNRRRCARNRHGAERAAQTVFQCPSVSHVQSTSGPCDKYIINSPC